jgi:hypothetical protein
MGYSRTDGLRFARPSSTMAHILEESPTNQILQIKISPNLFSDTLIFKLSINQKSKFKILGIQFPKSRFWNPRKFLNNLRVSKSFEHHSLTANSKSSCAKAQNSLRILSVGDFDNWETEILLSSFTSELPLHERRSFLSHERRSKTITLTKNKFWKLTFRVESSKVKIESLLSKIEYFTKFWWPGSKIWFLQIFIFERLSLRFRPLPMKAFLESLFLSQFLTDLTK